MSQHEQAVKPESFATFGDLLRYLRKRVQLSRAELARAAGYSESLIARLELNQRRPDPVTIQARFVPALELETEPAWVARLLALASGAETKRTGDHPPQHSGHDRSSAALLSLESSSLLATKLFVPRPQTPDVRRHRLLPRLDRALSVPLTLVVAPPGYGKTNLITSWIAERSSATDLPVSFAWLSLDASDNDIAAFARYLVAAFRRFAPKVGATTLALLQQPGPLPPDTLLASLINDLAMLPNSNVLVLEDAHLLTDRRVQGALVFLLEHLPQQVHLVLASREEPSLPLARLRGRGQVVEVHSRDLRFTTAESGRFLREAMGLDVTEAEVVTLDARTEGWAAGLQLVALALRERPGSASMVSTVSGNSRYLVDYLTDEVLDRLPAHLKTFALQTAILERLCGPLCDAVLGVGSPQAGRLPAEEHSDVHTSYSQILLEELERRQLFLVPLDDERRWYRYHTLFADLLRARLEQGLGARQVVALHERASRWFEDQGLIEEAIRHALAAGSPDQAARMIEERAEALIEGSSFTTLQRWLGLLPQTLIYNRHRLALAYTTVLLTAGDMSAVEPALQAAERAYAAAPAEATAHTSSQGWLDDVTGVALVHRGMLAQAQHDLRQAIALQQAALEHLPQRFQFRRSVAAWNLGMAYFVSGDLAGAEDAFGRMWADNAAPEHLYARIVAAFSLGHVRTIRGRLHEAEQLYRATLQQVAAAGRDLPAIAMIHIALGDLLREWNALELAGQHLAEGLQLSKQFGQLDVISAGYAILARLRQAQGDAGAAAAALAQAESVVPIGVFDIWSSPRARAWLAQGNIAAAERWATRDGISADSPASYANEIEQVVQARLLVLRAAYVQALPLLQRLIVSSEAGGRTSVTIEASALQALALAGSGDQAVALGALERALALAEPQGYVRLFLDEGAPMAALVSEAQRHGIAPRYCSQLLSAFPADSFSETA